jgi:citrate lyase subunit beta / citryl-CoA lyase
MRSKLFVPASRPELFAKALASAADSLSFDLEDSVGAEQKAPARQALAAALASPEFAATNKTLIVRVNAPSTTHFADDLEAVVHARVDYLNLPKIESAAEATAAAATIAAVEKSKGLTRPIPLLVNIESPRALRFAAEIASADARVAGLQLGFADLLEPLGIERTNTAAIQQIQLMVRLAAGEAGRWAYDAAWGDFKNADGFRAEAAAARRLGFLGKSCIHPSQIAIANEAFQPSPAELEFARRIVAAAANHSGAFALDGKMIDEPFIRRARALVGASAVR